MSDISLPNGIDAQGRYVHISQVSSGRTDLQCPYCKAPLTAKKGQRLAHHFAHTDDTCLSAAGKDFSKLDLPIYDRFNVYITAIAWRELQAFHARRSDGHKRTLLDHVPALISKGYGRYQYDLTQDGKIPFGLATLATFADFQLAYVLRRHNRLSDTAHRAYFGVRHPFQADVRHTPSAPEQVADTLADLNIYRAQLERLYGLDLYLLQIETSTDVLHKIGVSRDVERRIKEIERDLKPYYDVKRISLDRLCRNRGAVERYAHHRYAAHQHAVGTHQEYFQFDKASLSNVRRDFTSLGDLDCHDMEDWYLPSLNTGSEAGHYKEAGLIAEVLAGGPSYIEAKIWDDEYQQSHADATRRGMQRAKKKGVHIGRPSDTATRVIAKYPDVATALLAGDGIRSIASSLGVSRNTVRKVRDALEELS